MKNLLPAVALYVLFTSWGCTSQKDITPNASINKETIGIISPDSSISQKLGNDVCSILFNPDSVFAYRLFPTEIISDGISNTLMTHGEQKELTNQQIINIQSQLLSDHRNYANDSIIVMSPYIPAYQIKFYRNDSTAIAEISLSDHSWTLLYNNQTRFNHNFIVESLLNDISRELPTLE